MYWLEASVVVDGEGAEVVAEILRPYAYNNGVVLEQRGDANNVDPNALEPQVTVKIFVEEGKDTPELRTKISDSLHYLGLLYPIPQPTFKRIEDEDWSHAWRKHYHPFRVGDHLWIHPSWLEVSDTQSDDVVIAVDPGMAFGTGLHPSTQMCLRQLELLVEPNMSVMDVGTGSGILSAAAAKLGANHVLAFDTDYLAVASAVENVTRNGVRHVLRLFQGELDAVQPSKWDIVVVNILAPVIIHLLSRQGLATYLADDGRLILSGIIDEQEADVEAALTKASLVVSNRATVRDWVCLTAQKA